MPNHREHRSPSRLPDVLALLLAMQVIFIVGQLAGVLDWSWWYVFYPTILPIAFVLGVIAFGSVIAGFFALFIALQRRGPVAAASSLPIGSRSDERDGAALHRAG